jgi:DNA repair exonuclease SbcCD ATPase subunit
VLKVWNRKQADAQAQAASVKQRLALLTNRKNNLVDGYLDRRVRQSDYDEQDQRLSDEIEEAKTALRELEEDEERIEDLLEFADRVLTDPAGLWARASLEQRQRWQTVLFPNGLAYSRIEGFGTGQVPSFLNVLA